MKNLVMTGIAVLLIACCFAQKKWDGEGGDDQWSNALNWLPDGVPISSDDVILDNSIISSSYTVQLPAGSVSVSLLTLQIIPSSPATINLILPFANKADPGLAVTGTGDAFILENGATFKNSSGAATGNGILISSVFKIANGGRYIHNTTRGNANIINQLSIAAGTETGIFEFDVPGTTGYTLSLTGNNFGTLVFTASTGAKSYSGSGASTLTIRGDLIVNSGASVTSSMTADISLRGNLTVNGSLNLNPSTTGTANRRLIFTGNAIQQISGSGNISMNANFRNLEVASMSIVTLLRNINLPNANNGFLVQSDATLVTGTMLIQGNGTFTLSANGSVCIGSPDGIALTGSVGNIRTALRNFSTAGNYIFDGDGAQYSGNGLPASVQSLVTNKNSGNLELITRTRVTGTLNLNRGKIISSAANVLTITSSTILISPINNFGSGNQGWEQSFVDGPLGLENSSSNTVVLPIGKGNRFAPIKITKGNNNPVVYTAEYFYASASNTEQVANPPLDHVSALEYWNISTNTNSPDDDAQLALPWQPGSGVGTTSGERADLRIAHYFDNGSGERWEQEGTNPAVEENNDHGFVYSDNFIAGFSSFTLASSSVRNILPLKLLGFRAETKQNKIVLNWSIAMEDKVVKYMIEKSFDGQHYFLLHSVASRQQKDQSNYEIEDLKPTGNWNYYRLVIVENDNTVTISPITKAFFSISSQIRLFPNPVGPKLQIFLPFARSTYELVIVNSNGLLIKHLFVHSLPNCTLLVEDLKKGLYYIRVTTDSSIITRSFIKE